MQPGAVVQHLFKFFMCTSNPCSTVKWFSVVAHLSKDTFVRQFSFFTNQTVSLIVSLL